MRILYIDIDTLRPDHLSCYGYLRQTSPNIDAAAAAGVRFTNFYATDTPCLPSRTALFTGRFGICTGDPFWGIIREGGPLHANENSPAWRDYLERLRQTGRAHHAEKLEKFGGRPFTSGLER